MLTWVDSGGVRLAAEVIGEGEPVSVVAHGLTGSRRQLTLVAPFLPGTKVLFDFRGHGESERPPAGHYSMGHFAADVDAVARAFGATVAIGASLGGGATLRLLTRDPARFERLIFFLPARLGQDPESSLARARLRRIADLLATSPLEEAADRILALEEAEGAFDGFASSRELRRQAILHMNGDGLPLAIRECLEDPPFRDYAEVAPVSVPAIVVGQHHDVVHQISAARDLAAALSGAELIAYESPAALVAGIPELIRRISRFLTAAVAPQR